MGLAVDDVPPLTIAPPPVLPKVEWRRAWHAMRALIADPDRTELAFEVIAALSGADWERLFQRFASERAGRALLVGRASLLETLSDIPRLRALPAVLAGLEAAGVPVLSVTSHAWPTYVFCTMLWPAGRLNQNCRLPSNASQ